MSGSKLVRRKSILKELGLEAHASRSSWSHDLGESIVFDAWEHHWERNERGDLLRYPLRTNGRHYNLVESQQNPRRGHTRWQNHVELVLAEKHKPIAIVPVANDPNANPNKGAKGWLPVVIEGEVVRDNACVWFCAGKVKRL